MRVARNAIVMLAFVIAGCGGGGSKAPTEIAPGNTPGGGGGGGGGGTGNVVTVSDNSFSPANIMVSTGAAVTWNWAGAYTAHNVTFDNGSGGSGDKVNGSYNRTFPTAGSFTYSCTNHPGMDGAVTVQ